ncbi:TPA: hypothetical protein ACMDRZ_000773 [Vibrio cholerae]|uniref:hypothetical protein n=1 Tax=Vibrio cholerae TaxID=666 RepID=UPI001582B46C|nr:hypothetical protein [Vibrio cholerae]EHK8999788.1 hypothetical protein [Vibrio vulnificus]EHK9015383.1 hypothetical protein [Vibrio vulnificus]EHU4994667.1 hypothetical protein [Vibrio vulnificus]EIO3939001.1 hypothetical protein [Vibrio vulnificus]QKU62669.1 hypothetical protein HPY17_04735 [Vibrio cholerae]
MEEQNRTSLWYKFGLLVCRLLNHLPVFHASRDNGFDSVDSLAGLRFSLLSLPWGDKHIYLFTYINQGNFKERFKWVSILRILDIKSPRQQEELAQLEADFLDLDDDTGGSKSKLRMEFLKHKNAECQNSINTLNNKVNSYIAIALVYTGLFSFLFQSILELGFSHFSVLMWLAFGFSSISLINVLVLLRSYLQVKGTLKSRFSSFKFSPDFKQLAKSIYIDWLTSQDEQWEAATLVKNIEKYFIRSLFFSSLILFSTVLQPFIQQVPSDAIKLSNDEFILIDKEGNFSPQELLSLSKAVTPDNIIIFVYSSSNSSGNASANFMISALNLSKQSTVIKISDELFDPKLLIATVKEEK